MDKKVIDTYTETISEKNTVKSISIKNLFGMFNYNVNFENKNIFDYPESIIRTIKEEIQLRIQITD